MPLDPAKVRSRRESLGLSQKEAADAAGISQPHWFLIESGKRPDPALSTAERVAAALKYPLVKLLAG